MIGWLRQWLFPFTAETQQIMQHRDQLVADVRRKSVVMRWQSRQLRRETTAQRVRSDRLIERQRLMDEVLDNVENRRGDND